MRLPCAQRLIESSAFSGSRNLVAFDVDPLNETYSSLDGILLDKSQETIVLHPRTWEGDPVIPEGVLHIGRYEFAESVLTSISIPEGVLSIGHLAFASCPNVTTATIPASATELEFMVFPGSTNLAGIVVDPLNADYYSLDGVVFTKDATAPLHFAGGRSGEYSIPAGVTRIEAGAFWASR